MEHAGRAHDSRREIALLAVLHLTVWGWSLGNGFVYDDLANIEQNPWIRDWTLLGRSFLHHAAGYSADYSTSFYRPLMHVLYALVYGSAGVRPWAYHLLNVALHSVCVLGVYGLTREVLTRWGDLERHRHLPLIASIVFSLHPIHTEPVEWIAGLTDLSYACAGLMALIVYLRASLRPRLAFLAAALLLVSLLCKETAVAILLLMAVVEALNAREAGWSARAALVRLAPALAAAAVYMGLRIAALGSLAPSASAHPHSIPQLAACASSLFARYLALLVAPVRLAAMRAIPQDVGFGDPAALAGIAALAGLALAASAARRSHVVLLSLGFGVLPILPSLYVPAIEGGASLVGERYLYLPVLGVALLVGLGLEEARHRYPWGARGAIVVMGLFVLSASAADVARNRVWADSLSFWADAAVKSPENAAAHEGLCFALYESGRVQEALDACSRAIAIDPGRTDAKINHATALLALGRAAEAKRELDDVLVVRSRSAEALVNRGLACMMLGEVAEAMASYRRALEFEPANAEAHNVLGVALIRSGRRDEALSHFEEASRLAPESAEYRENLRIAREGEAPGD